MVGKSQKAQTKKQTRIGKLVQEAREKRGWTRSDLAREIWGEMPNPNSATGGQQARNRYLVTVWETGRSLPQMKILPEVARVLGVKLKELQQARLADEHDRVSNKAQPDIVAGIVAGRPDLVTLTARVIVRLEDFPALTQTLNAAAERVAE